MKPEVILHLRKAQQVLGTARNLVADGYDNAAARDAYIASYHAAQAYIVNLIGKAAKKHNDVHTQFAQLATLEPRITPDLLSFLPTAYNLNAVVDYEFGEGSNIPHNRAAVAVEAASRFIDCIADLLPEATVATR